MYLVRLKDFQNLIAGGLKIFVLLDQGDFTVISNQNSVQCKVNTDNA